MEERTKGRTKGRSTHFRRAYFKYQKAQKRALLEEDTEDIYPYGRNERARKHNTEAPVGKLFFSIPKTKQQSARYRNNKYYLKNDTITDFFYIIQNEIIYSFYKMCIIVNNLKKILKQII